MRHWLSAGLVLGVALFASPVLAADVVSVGEKFSVDLADAHLCFAVPLERRRDDACEGIPIERFVAPPKRSDTEVLAVGLRTTATAEPLMVIVTELRGFITQPLSVDAEVASGAKGLGSTLPPGARVAEQAGEDVHYGDVRGVRASFKVSGLAAGARTVEYTKILHVSSYTVSVMGPLAEASEVDQLFETLCRTVTVAKPKYDYAPQAAEAGYQAGLWTNRILGLGALIIGGGIALRESRRRKKKPAQ